MTPRVNILNKHAYTGQSINYCHLISLAITPQQPARNKNTDDIILVQN